MAIVMISSLYQGCSGDMAQALAEKTHWPMLCREDLLEKARTLGIKIGRLETAIIKRPVMPEKLAREKDLYLALITATLCEKALEGNLIYHGRTGHLLLPGVSHRLRVGLTVPMDVRIQRTAKALNLSLERSETYLTQLDEDVRQWAHFIHHSDAHDPNQFDLFFNLETISLDQAAHMVFSMTEMPKFKAAQLGISALNNLHLASQARLRLALDERTAGADLQILSDRGVLTITYPPHQKDIGDIIPKVLSDMNNCRKIECTMAETNILWVQERFEPESDAFHHIIRLSQRWGAAVELLRLTPPEGRPGEGDSSTRQQEPAFGRQAFESARDGGVEDDDHEAEDDGGLTHTQEELIRLGRSGGRHSVCGGYEKILENVQGRGQYSLVVIGNMFLDKILSTRTRRTRELAMLIRDRLKAPVITTDELKSRFLFGKRQALSLVGLIALSLFIYILVFTHQDQILTLISGSFHEQHKWLSPLMVVVASPLIAYIYGAAAGLLLKMINID